MEQGFWKSSQIQNPSCTSKDVAVLNKNWKTGISCKIDSDDNFDGNRGY